MYSVMHILPPLRIEISTVITSEQQMCAGKLLHQLCRDWKPGSDDVQIFDFELSSSDVEAINRLNRNLRLVVPLVVRNG